jgi:transposase-like protein
MAKLPIAKESELIKYGYKKFTSGAKCRECGSTNRWYQDIGDDVYEDYRYRCNNCGDTYIVEGDDG